MFCTNCGKEISDDSNFCPSCSHQVSRSGASEKNNKPRSSKIVKILIGFTIALVIFLFVPFAAYFFITGKPKVYKHPVAGFSLNYPRFLKIETPALPESSTCKKAAPCLVVFKDPSHDDYVVNFIFVMAASDAGVTKEKFIDTATASLKEDVHNNVATVSTISGQQVYKYTKGSEKSDETIEYFSMLFSTLSGEKSDYDQIQTIEVFFHDDSMIAIFFREAPAEAQDNYDNYLDTSSLSI
ncbi:MAG: zinc-ribbon domain-containing protein [Candidatus Pacebacteria bacterium]|nr:zinc-ribbon domain-containing protein [Candidatus Paceibacterota bacterium]